jgi:hypothetical protein
MAYTKKIARHDKITIDGTDVSNSFKTMGRPSVDATEDVSGFSTTGNDETLPGSRAQSFTGEAFYTEELALILEPRDLLGQRDAERVLAVERPRVGVRVPVRCCSGDVGRHHRRQLDVEHG